MSEKSVQKLALSYTVVRLTSISTVLRVIHRVTILTCNSVPYKHTPKRSETIVCIKTYVRMFTAEAFLTAYT